MNNIEIAIRVARDAINDHDPGLAAYVVKDFIQLEELDLKELAEAYYVYGCTCKEAMNLIDRIESGLNLKRSE